MRISDDSISEEAVDVTESLSDRWSTEMSYVERFSDIRTDIVDENGFSILTMRREHLFLEKKWEPDSIRQEKIHISTGRFCRHKDIRVV
mgnify:CR=1 FL=1